MMLPSNPGPIGIFDSGYGGLTILHGLRQLLPQYDYMYLGDNARAPYGSRSFEVVYKFTRQAVIKLFSMGCHLVILGCNTASAKALRSIQQRDIPELDPDRRVLGIIRPTAEVIGELTKSRHVGILATEGTIKSESYKMEIGKLWPHLGFGLAKTQREPSEIHPSLPTDRIGIVTSLREMTTSTISPSYSMYSTKTAKTRNSIYPMPDSRSC